MKYSDELESMDYDSDDENKKPENKKKTRNTRGVAKKSGWFFWRT
jgi:hypothetical protein